MKIYEGVLLTDWSLLVDETSVKGVSLDLDGMVFREVQFSVGVLQVFHNLVLFSRKTLHMALKEDMN